MDKAGALPPKNVGHQPAQKPKLISDDALDQMLDYAQMSLLVLLGSLITAMVALTFLSMLGVLPWLEIEARLGSAVIPSFGPAVQVIFTLFCVALLCFLPASARVLKLERSHRTFALTLEDLERAYRAAHAADRAGAFTLSQEFNAVQERLAFLRRHPSLANLEPEILDSAAQMSYLSRDLAEVYSDDAVHRARAFLAQRQQEAEQYQTRLDSAVTVTQELKAWMAALDKGDAEAQRKVDGLARDLSAMLPRMGISVETAGAKVVPLPKKRETAEGS